MNGLYTPNKYGELNDTDIDVMSNIIKSVGIDNSLELMITHALFHKGQNGIINIALSKKIIEDWDKLSWKLRTVIRELLEHEDVNGGKLKLNKYWQAVAKTHHRQSPNMPE